MQTIVPEMQSASIDMEQEVQRLEHEEAVLLESVRQTVGSMSDLRYGRLANSKLKNEVVDGLKEFQQVCKRKG